jgi:transposase
VLVPELLPGDIVVMDNLSSHKRAAVREKIQAAGTTMRVLPPNSPDFNPIEKASLASRPCSARSANEPSAASGT